MLKCETNTTAVRKHVIRAARHTLGALHHKQSIFFEHGQWWVSCMICGASWSVVDAQQNRVDFLDFEEVAHGDNFCLDQSIRERRS
jgi:hypothetical protein